MSGRAFLDTNILLYCFDRVNYKKALTANEILKHALLARSAVISFQVVQEFFNVALKGPNPALTISEADPYFTTVLVPLLAVHSSPKLYSRALQLKARYQFAWYDSLIVAGALESGCNTLLTEDMQHGMRIDNLRIENPFLPR